MDVTREIIEKHTNPKTGLVPVTINVSEAGLGLREGEVRGLDPDVAFRMCNKAVTIQSKEGGSRTVPAATLVKVKAEKTGGETA